MAIPERILTAEGAELHFATNHLGHFALATGLCNALIASGNARVVSLSSTAHLYCPVLFDDPTFAFKWIGQQFQGPRWPLRRPPTPVFATHRPSRRRMAWASSTSCTAPRTGPGPSGSSTASPAERTAGAAHPAGCSLIGPAASTAPPRPAERTARGSSFCSGGTRGACGGCGPCTRSRVDRTPGGVRESAFWSPSWLNGHREPDPSGLSVPSLESCPTSPL